MIIKKQVIFNESSKRFKYMQYKKIKKVDMIDLNARLNRTKKLNFYNNAKIIIFFLTFLTILMFISLNFNP